MKKCLLLILFPVLFMACKPDTECRTSVDIGMQVVFAIDSLQGDTMQVNLTSIDSITVQGVGNDSLLYDNDRKISNIFLPLKTDANSTVYALRAYNKEDTLYIEHDNNVTFVSLACGCNVYHTITAVTHKGGLIDSIVMLNASVESYKQDNVRLYMHLRK